MKKIILNPFQTFSEKKLIAFGITTALIAIILSVPFNGRFDGVIDLHFVQKTTLLKSALDILIGILIITIMLFIIGKYINKKTRFIDILSSTLIAKIPFYFLLFFNINNLMFNTSEKLIDMFLKNKPITIENYEITLLFFSAIATFICLIWSIILLFNGFKIATNLKETKHIIFFIITLIIAEILSKILIFKLN